MVEKKGHAVAWAQDEIQGIECFAVNADDPDAMSAVRKLAEHCTQAGAVVLLSADEFKALRKSVVKLVIDNLYRHR